MQTFIPSILTYFVISVSLVAQTEQIVLATGVDNGRYHEIGLALAGQMDTDPKYELTVQTSDGSLSNIESLRKGETDFALIQGALPHDLYDLRGVSVVADEWVHVLIPKGAPYQNLRSLIGKRIAVGPKDGGSAVLAASVYQFLDGKQRTRFIFSSIDDVPNLLTNNEVDASFLVFGLHAPFIDEQISRKIFRLMSTPEAGALSHYVPGLQARQMDVYEYSSVVQPTSPPRGIAVPTLLVCRQDTPDTWVNLALNSLYDIRTKKAGRLSNLTESFGRQIVDLPLHDAAQKYYKRNDPVSADRFEVWSFYLAGTIALVSGVHFLLGYIDRRRTNRKRKVIRPHFERMLEFGEAVEKATDIDGLINLLHEMMSAQRDAEKSWLKGKLDTEHMENLYSVYNIRSRNAIGKIHKFQNGLTIEKLEKLEPIIEALAKERGIDFQK
jgi:TRAP transporter TAXI family solute receptor